MGFNSDGDQVVDLAAGATVTASNTANAADGGTAASESTLVAGKDGSGNQQDLEVSPSGAVSITPAANVDDASGGTDTGAVILVKRVDSPGVITPANGDYTVLQVDNQGNLRTSEAGPIGIAVSGTDVSATDPFPTEDQGVSDFFFDADGNNAAQVASASAAQLVGISVSNINAADAFLQLFNTAAGSVTVGTTTPVLSFLIPKGDATNYGSRDIMFPKPIDFDTAITYACTTTPTGAGDPSTGLVVNLLLN